MKPREILGVQPNADMNEIKQAYRKAAKELHPDLSDSPEAAEAFSRIKAAHGALTDEAATPRESAGLHTATARAAAATAQSAFTPASDDQMSYEEIQHIQDLDDEVYESPKKSLFKRKGESEELKKHRRRIKINEKRLRGLY